MCATVRNGGDVIETAEELLDLTGMLIPSHGYDHIHLDGCLCQVDVDATLKAVGMSFRQDVFCSYWLTENMQYQDVDGSYWLI